MKKFHKDDIVWIKPLQHVGVIIKPLDSNWYDIIVYNEDGTQLNYSSGNEYSDTWEFHGGELNKIVLPIEERLIHYHPLVRETAKREYEYLVRIKASIE